MTEKSPVLSARRLAAALILLPGLAQATTLTCANIGDQVYPVGATQNLGLTFSLKEGEVITISASNPSGVGASIEPGGQGDADSGTCNASFPGEVSCDGYQFSRAADNNFLEAFSTDGTDSTLAITCAEGDVAEEPEEEPDQSRTTTTTTGPNQPHAAPAGPTAARVAQSVTTGARAAAGGQAAAVGTAVARATGSRLSGGGGFSMAESGAFLSTMSTPGGATMSWNGWASVEARQFSGNAEGARTDFVLGYDTFVGGSDTIAGFFVAHEQFDLDDGIVDVSARGFSFGPYVATRVGAVVIDGHLGYGRPEYDFGATDYEAERLFGGAAVRGSLPVGAVTLTPFASVATWRESHPSAVIRGTRQAARDISATSARLGTRVDFGDLGGIAPYVSAAAAFSRVDDGLGNDESWTSGRYGAGFSTTGGPGTLSLDIDAGEEIEGIDDLGVRLNYVFSF
ncbi:hypothetical protein [Histidinibacterium lentulum]|uniref:hypothetical protein n=1 Tax=Histidinibacterium lentulum TaxID=2480588 RepID=UPI00161CB421|nr:hypothetical protein [Histidinibacterium lentulum]